VSMSLSQKRADPVGGRRRQAAPWVCALLLLLTSTVASAEEIVDETAFTYRQWLRSIEVFVPPADYPEADPEGVKARWNELVETQPDGEDLTVHGFHSGKALARAGHYEEALQVVSEALQHTGSMQPNLESWLEDIHALVEINAKLHVLAAEPTVSEANQGLMRQHVSELNRWGRVQFIVPMTDQIEFLAAILFEIDTADYWRCMLLIAEGHELAGYLPEAEARYMEILDVAPDDTCWAFRMQARTRLATVRRALE
jgi:hypothetical protein